VKGIKLKPIRLRNSLYLLIPMEVAKLFGITKDTKFILTLEPSEECILVYKKTEGLNPKDLNQPRRGSD